MDKEAMIQYDEARKRVQQRGGQTMLLHLDNGFWLVRFLVPNFHGAREGHYAEGYNASLLLAVREAMEGVAN